MELVEPVEEGGGGGGGGGSNDRKRRDRREVGSKIPSVYPDQLTFLSQRSLAFELSLYLVLVARSHARATRQRRRECEGVGGWGRGGDKREFSFSSASHGFAALLSVGSRLALLASLLAGRIKVVFLNNPTRLTDKGQLSGPQDHPLDHSLSWCRHQVFEVRWTTFTFEQNNP